MSNIYDKINEVKLGISKADLKKSGYNKFSNFYYYELSDFLPKIIELCQINKLFTKLTFTLEKALLEIIDNEDINSKEEYEIPTTFVKINGCNDMQSLGSVQTYARRYLYMNAFDITESDLMDKISGDKERMKEEEKQFKAEIDRFKSLNLQLINIGVDTTENTFIDYVLKKAKVQSMEVEKMDIDKVISLNNVLETSLAIKKKSRKTTEKVIQQVEPTKEVNINDL